MIKLFLIENRPAVGEGLQLLLDAESDLRVVGEAPDCESAIRMIRSFCPDVVLLDVDAPHLDCAAAAVLRCIPGEISVIILSLSDDTRARRIAGEIGAFAVVDKSMPAEALLSTIREVARAR